MDQQPTFPTEGEFRNHLRQYPLGQRVLNIFDRCSEGLETRYETDFKIDDRENVYLCVNDGEQSKGYDQPFITLSLEVEHNRAGLTFDMAKYLGKGCIDIYVDLDTGKSEVLNEESETVDLQGMIEFIDRARRLSSVGEDVLPLLSPEIGDG